MTDTINAYLHDDKRTGYKDKAAVAVVGDGLMMVP